MLEVLAAGYLNRHQSATAEGYARQALGVEQRAEHRIGEASALQLVGLAAMGTGRLEEAIALFTRSRELHEQQGNLRASRS